VQLHAVVDMSLNIKCDQQTYSSQMITTDCHLDTCKLADYI